LRDAARHAVPQSERGGIVEPSSVKRRLTCILAADAVGYSQQMGRDEEGTIRVLAAHRAVIDGIIGFHEGRIVSTAGDSVIAEFPSAVDSVRCAVEIQDALKTRNDALPEHRQMRFRIGVNLGDVVVKNDDLLGDGVNVAARLETMAEPGGICISSSVYDQITGKLDLGFQDIGNQTLKNISRPIHVYRVSGAGAPLREHVASAPAAPPAPRAPRPRGTAPWAIGAVAFLLIGAAVAWQAGVLRFGAVDGAGRATVAVAPAPAVSVPPAAPAVVPPPVPEKSPAPAVVADARNKPAQADPDVLRARTEADAARRQAEVELARVRAAAQADRVAKERAQADAARIRADAEAAVAKIRSDAKVVAAAPVAAPAKPAPPAAPPAVPMSFAEAQEAAASAGARRFDGAWNVTLDCPKTDAAQGYVNKFVAQVKDGYLQGAFGTEGTPGSLRLQGSIRPDGTAKFEVKGLTGDPKYSVKNDRLGTPYGYDVVAEFEGARGTGRRLQVRACGLTFARQ
jgi:class 3 adenylate cyclase